MDLAAKVAARAVANYAEAEKAKSAALQQTHATPQGVSVNDPSSSPPT